MKHKFHFASTALIIAVSFMGAALVWAAPSSKEELLETIKASIAKKDAAALKALCATENADSELLAMSQAMIAQMASMKIKDISLVPLAANFRPEEVVGNEVYKSNVNVLGEVCFKLDGDNNPTMSMPYGEKNGKFYIASSHKEKIN